jgi:hypothetical protein
MSHDISEEMLQQTLAVKFSLAIPRFSPHIWNSLQIEPFVMPLLNLHHNQR